MAQTAEETSVARIVAKVPGIEGAKIAIRKDATPKEILDEMESTFRRQGEIDRRSGVNHYIMGTVGLRVSRQKLFREAGFATMKEYLHSLDEKFGHSYQNVYKCMQVMKYLPETTPDDFATVGMAKLREIAQAVRSQSRIGAPLKAPTITALLEAGARHSGPELKREIKKRVPSALVSVTKGYPVVRVVCMHDRKTPDRFDSLVEKGAKASGIQQPTTDDNTKLREHAIAWLNRQDPKVVFADFKP